MNLIYVVPRLARHFLPEWLVRRLLLQSLIIRPGLETADPRAAVARYLGALQALQMEVRGRSVLVFGYGGRFDVGVGLLEAGARRVGLCDKFARPDDNHNARLLKSHPGHLQMQADGLRPVGERLQLIEGDVRELDAPEPGARYDLIISNSVYEHLDDPAGTTRALARWSTRAGLHLHFIDLRDHFFKFPFEMLCYSEVAWRRWLNPTSNHNRLRMWEYRRIFQASFEHVELTVLGRDEQGLERVRRRLRPEFVSGDVSEDAVTLLQVAARDPRV